jgi:hypothetical protein
MDRKLASVQLIRNIEPIKDADAIEKATVLGWEVVIAKKDNLRVGDLVVYIETDSVVPEKPEYEFLRERRFRIRTIKLRGQISQGLVLPLTVLPLKRTGYVEGDDVTELLGITKYLSPTEQTEARLAEEAIAREKNRIKRFFMKNKWFRRLFTKEKRGFPKFITKSDEDRIQLFPNICEIEKDTPFTVTEKLDGQSGTWFLVKEKGWFRTKYRFGVCSRNIYRKTPDNSSYWKIARKYKIEDVLKKLIGKEMFIAIQGEIIGQGIQENKYKLQDVDMYVFNLILPSGRVDQSTLELNMLRHGLQAVPRLEYNFKLRDSIHEVVEYAKGQSTLLDIPREGIVVRNYDKKLSFKVINPLFLLKYNE